MTLPEPDFTRVRAALEQGATPLDETTRRRLTEARRVAVAASRSTPRWRGFAVPAAALTAVLALWLGLGDPPSPLPARAPSADVAEYAQGLAVATEGETVALDEDLEFYAWLDAQSQDG